MVNPYRKNRACSAAQPLHALDEAECFKKMMDAGHTPEDVAATIRQSPSYVYQRLRLLKLTKELRVEFRADRIEFGHAYVISKLAANRQKRALQACFERGRLVSVRLFRSRL